MSRRYRDGRDELARLQGYSISRYRALNGSIRWAYTIVRDDFDGQRYVDGFERRAGAVQAARTALHGPLMWSTWQVPCPYCGAAVREMCTSPTGRVVPFHTVRDDLAARQAANTPTDK